MRQFSYAVLVFMVLVAVASAWVADQFEGAGPLEAPVTVVIPPGSHFTDIAEMLAQNNVIRHPLLFEVLVFARGESARFKAGEYAFPPHISAGTAAYMIAGGKTVVHHLTVAEGLMTSEILDIVNHTPELTGEITLDLHEGDLLPETYNFSRGDKRNDILTRMHAAQQKALADAWAERAPNLPLTTPQQALTLASIVEKETGIAAERSHVAAVYINRLKKGMLLQADPTTAYAITQGKQKLSRALTLDDLAFDSPYNTYRVHGLPPGPIANPGKASLVAALHPLASDDLYFVATGTGGHNFAATAEEHAANVQKYRAQQKAQAAK